MFSVMKRKFGESFKARKYRLQVKEIKIKVILYNLSRLMIDFVVLIGGEEFYRAEIISLFNGFVIFYPDVPGFLVVTRHAQQQLSFDRFSRLLASPFYGWRIYSCTIRNEGLQKRLLSPLDNTEFVYQKPT